MKEASQTNERKEREKIKKQERTSKLEDGRGRDKEGGQTQRTSQRLIADTEDIH